MRESAILFKYCSEKKLKNTQSHAQALRFLTEFHHSRLSMHFYMDLLNQMRIFVQYKPKIYLYKILTSFDMGQHPHDCFLNGFQLQNFTMIRNNSLKKICWKWTKPVVIQRRKTINEIYHWLVKKQRANNKWVRSSRLQCLSMTEWAICEQ